MKTITRQVESWLRTHPSILDCLKRQLVNYSSLSRLLVKELSLTSDSFDAVLIACRRYAAKLSLQKVREEQIADILGKSTLDIKNKITVVVVEKQDVSLLLELERKARQKAEPFYLIEGTGSFTIVTSNAMLAEAQRLIGRRTLKLDNDLALVTIRSPHAIETTPGVLAAIVSILSDNDINIVENMSCWTDTLFVVTEQDAAKVLQMLRF